MDIGLILVFKYFCHSVSNQTCEMRNGISQEYWCNIQNAIKKTNNFITGNICNILSATTEQVFKYSSWTDWVGTKTFHRRILGVENLCQKQGLVLSWMRAQNFSYWTEYHHINSISRSHGITLNNYCIHLKSQLIVHRLIIFS